MDSDSELNLVSLISQLKIVTDDEDTRSRSDWEMEGVWKSKIRSLFIEIISLVRTMDLASQPKPESKLMSLVSQAITLFKSMDMDSLPKPLLELISYISQQTSPDLDQKTKSDLKLKVPFWDAFQLTPLISHDIYTDPETDCQFMSLVVETLEVKPNPELVSLIRQIVYVVFRREIFELEPILLVPQVKGKYRYDTLKISDTWRCFAGNWKVFSLTRDNKFSHFRCRGCNGENHKEYEKAPVEIKHLLHPKHSLQLVFNKSFEWVSSNGTRKCYCCDEDLIEVFYFCSACDFAMNIACSKKAPDLYIPPPNPPKWHDHTLALFPRRAFLTCNVCALDDSSSPIYMCPPCDFVVHLKCNKLPRVLRISRHPHRLRHTLPFEEGNRPSCGVCRRKINNDYGGYSCVTEGCSYAAHSRCATQSNVWDGKDLDGEPEDIEDKVPEPFVRKGDGIIQHFSHDQDHHHLRLDENTCRAYDDNKLCQACITPIYFGNFYSCVQCEFILHETCAHLSRKIYHPIHPHLLTLAMMEDIMDLVGCSACDRSLPTAGFSYYCDKEECDFLLHVQCATISEPLVHTSHEHHLFLTSKPNETRECSVCRRGYKVKETFNCIDECKDFALCFSCATLPQKLRYKHDKHILTLSYGEKTDTVIYWCEACEENIDPEVGFYKCDEYCCVTLHVKCLIGKELYMKPGSSFFYDASGRNVKQVGVQSNNHHMSRPICIECRKRCLDKIVFQCCGIHCSLGCLYNFLSQLPS